MLTDYQTKVTDLIRDDAGKITSTNLDDAIADAVLRYSGDRPKLAVEDVTGQSGETLDLPDGWEAGFSDLRTLEYPVGDVPPSYIERDLWTLYDTPTGQEIQLVDSVAAASTVRMAYTVVHTVTDSVDTIPLVDREAVAKWAAALCCDQLAAWFANEGDSTIQADRVQGGSRSAEYARRARDYRKGYLDAIGVEEKDAAPSGTVVSMVAASRRTRFFHN